MAVPIRDGDLELGFCSSSCRWRKGALETCFLPGCLVQHANRSYPPPRWAAGGSRRSTVPGRAMEAATALKMALCFVRTVSVCSARSSVRSILWRSASCAAFPAIF